MSCRIGRLRMSPIDEEIALSETSRKRINESRTASAILTHALRPALHTYKAEHGIACSRQEQHEKVREDHQSFARTGIVDRCRIDVALDPYISERNHKHSKKCKTVNNPAP